MSLILLDSLLDDMWPSIQRMERSMGTTDVDKSGDFRYTCNFQGFRPSDISVQHNGDMIVIEAEQKLNSRNEHYARSLKRSIQLPKDVDRESVRCELNERGEIVVCANKLAAVNEPKKYSIPITFKKSENQQ
ncbi:Heat shock protein Hsp20 domain containing protein [Aphelenchoides besseyi]|nr:Heat shock protein Hsp20 domain containing protein [Aphelenchoides besseyi]KAI6194592.1 Heat shock protein Hsp20 domain containing protein [Aphelenchoides besseyi]KAI6194671.1 Heat shock protein Hsp20 domain containing protein [Aphelenchoides besseyi]